jgi:phosphoglucomutase
LREIYAQWLKETAENEEIQAELKAIEGDEKEIEERFYKHLTFGTGGLRGILGAGTNRMNEYVIARISLALADYLQNKYSSPSVAIAYDSRKKSDVFAHVAASVLISRGIKAYLFGELMPTPILSFAVRHLGASAGIVVTASHNPKEYNGYKVYDHTGCQITTQAAEEIWGYAAQHSYLEFDPLVKENYGKITYIGEEVVDRFLERVGSYCKLGDPADLKIVYTPLNGTGNKPVRALLKKQGFENVTVVAEQELPDSDFTTCPYPNPELKEALRLAIEYAEKEGADIVLATDPDCDRVGVAYQAGGGYRILTGNEVGILLTNFLVETRQPKEPIIISTIVSSTLPEFIVKSSGGEAYYVYTGFKFIGEKMNELERSGDISRHLLAMEESCGYLIGDYARDKDGVGASLLICEMASYYKSRGKTLGNVLADIYKKYGYLLSKLYSFEFKGIEGERKIAGIMSALRKEGLQSLAGEKVSQKTDYLEVTHLEKADVLSFSTDKVKLIIRPSGTEAKIKFYLHVSGDTQENCEGKVRLFEERELEKILKS